MSVKMGDFGAAQRLGKTPAFMTLIKPCRNALAACPRAFRTKHGYHIVRGNDVSLCICEVRPLVARSQYNDDKDIDKIIQLCVSSGTCIPVKEDCKWISVHLGL